MATINLAITIPDEQVPRLQAAMRRKFGGGLTNEQIIERVRLNLVIDLIAFVRQQEREAALASAAQSVTPVEIV